MKQLTELGVAFVIKPTGQVVTWIKGLEQETTLVHTNIKEAVAFFQPYDVVQGDYSVSDRD